MKNEEKYRAIKFRQLLINKKTKSTSWHYWGFIDGKYYPPVNWFLYGHEILDENPQFTGLTDKNGKEIYEGDILFGREEGDGETTAWTDVYYIVFFKEGCFKVREKRIDEDSCWCYLLCENDITDEYEVIGNIHENPELLK